MKNYPFNFDTLHDFSNSLPYGEVLLQYTKLFESLNELRLKYRFPAIENNIGAFFSFYLPLLKPKKIFEMGSGYGHSAFWYLNAGLDELETVYLTERREDLISEFKVLDWPESFRSKCDYFQGDAFEKLSLVQHIDFLLIDGQKSDYLKFLDKAYPKLSKNGHVAIDNSYWRGSFLDSDKEGMKNSAKQISELHSSIKDSEKYKKVFLPFRDGLTLLQKKD